MMIALPPEDWSDLGSMSLPQFSSLLQDARPVSQPKSFYFKFQKTEEEKAQTALRPTPSSCLHGSTASPEKAISGFAKQMSQQAERFAN